MGAKNELVIILRKGICNYYYYYYNILLLIHFLHPYNNIVKYKKDIILE